jgi:hypothetical protein
MPDDCSEEMVQLLREIRDLTRDRNSKIDELLQQSRQRREDQVQRQNEVRARILNQRRRFLWILILLFLIAIAFLAYLAFWVIPKSEQRDFDRWMETTQMMQSNHLAQPH